MTARSEPGLVAHIAGAIGILAQVAGAYYFILLPAMTVPSPWNFGFFIPWFALVGLAIAWWRWRPWRSFLVPIISIPLAIVLHAAGTQLMGWRP